MNFNLGRMGRNSVQMQSRQATDTHDSGTYHIASLAYIRDFADTPYQTSVGVALRQDTVSDADRRAQDSADLRKRAAADKAYRDEHGLNKPADSSDTTASE